MGFKRYKGPVLTLEQASFADMPVRITCDHCGNFKQMHAYSAMQLLSPKRKETGVPLFRPVSGLFRCRQCRRNTVIITAPMQSAY